MEGTWKRGFWCPWPDSEQVQTWSTSYGWHSCLQAVPGTRRRKFQGRCSKAQGPYAWHRTGAPLASSPRVWLCSPSFLSQGNTKAVVWRCRASISPNDRMQQPPSQKLPCPSLLPVACDVSKRNQLLLCQISEVLGSICYSSYSIIPLLIIPAPSCFNYLWTWITSRMASITAVIFFFFCIHFWVSSINPVQCDFYSSRISQHF